MFTRAVSKISTQLIRSNCAIYQQNALRTISTKRFTPISCNCAVLKFDTVSISKLNYCTETPIKPKNKKKPKKGKPSVDHVGRLDLRVGKVVDVQKVPDADALYTTKVNIGEPDNVSIVAGIAKFVPIEEMKDLSVVVLCNLKESKLRGHVSQGMILCAQNDSKTEPLVPPKGSNPGDIIHCEQYERELPDTFRSRQKLFDPLAADLAINDTGVACYKGAYFYIPDKGNVTSKTLRGAKII